MPLTAGTRFGGYTIVGPLGAGGMGEVYKARDGRLDRFVALKVLHTTRATEPSFRDRFEREARAVAALTHPNIVTVYSIEEEDGRPFLTMELVDGRTLSEMIPSGGAPLQQFLLIAIPLADAVAAAHARGITHRDLKPANVMVSAEGRLKVLDFGLAKLTETPVVEFTAMATGGQLTAQGQVVGTVAYMSPEQAEGKTVDHRSDIFSLGIILYELATGRKPFTGDTNISLLSSILRDAPPMVSDLNVGIPREIARLIRRCLEKDPAKRLQSALDLKHELEDLRNEGTSSVSIAGMPPSPPAAAAPSSTGGSQVSAVSPAPHTSLTRAVAVLAGVVIIGAAYFAWTRASSAPPSAGTKLASSASSKSAVTVARFENRTGDSSLEPIGQMAADAIAQQVPRLQSDLVQALTQVSALRQRIALTHASVTGVYYLDGQNLRIQPSVTDASGAQLYTLETVVGPRTDPGRVVDLAADRAMGAVATILDSDFSPRHPSRPPGYRAYREYKAGVDVFADEPLKAATHFRRAAELDPEFYSAYFYLATLYSNVGDRTREREMIDLMNTMSDRLNASERALLTYRVSTFEGRLIDALKAARDEVRIDPGDLIANYFIGFNELRLNHPQATLDEFAKVNADVWNQSTIGSWRHTRIAWANHLLGRHEEELRVARAAKALVPSSLATRNDELYALAALGRVDDLRRAVDEILGTATIGAGTPGGSMRAAAEELRVHGRREEAIALAKRAVDWYRSQQSESQAREPERLALAQALYTAEDWVESGKIASALLREHPDNAVYIGAAGAVSARTGDRATAAKRAAALADMPFEPGGANELRRAQLAALLGEKDQALTFLRNAFAHGLPMSLGLHRQMDFEPLRGYVPFDELMKPKG